MKSDTAHIQSLPQDSPREVLSIGLEGDAPKSSMATVYAALATQTQQPVRLELVAGLQGHTSLIAAAGIAPGWEGIAMVATGVCVDGWHVKAVGGGSDVSLNLALCIGLCCSSYAVFVPPDVQQRVPESLLRPTMAARPFGQTAGLYRALMGVSGAVDLETVDRVIRIEAFAGPAGATVNGFPGGQTWTIPPDQRAELSPLGNLTGPATLNFNGTASYTVERVR